MLEKIRAYVGTQLKTQDFTDETPLFSQGRIDSLGVLEMIMFLEENFQIEIDTMKHELMEFDTVTSISKLVNSLKG